MCFSEKAFFVGTLVTLSSLCHMACLLTFFHVCNKATKFKQEAKRKYDHDFKEGKFGLFFWVFEDNTFKHES